MTISPYFKNFSYQPVQRLMEDMIVESMKIYGYEMYYMPQNYINMDDLLGENPVAVFDKATQFEVYIKNLDAYAGEGHFMSKFNLEVRDSLTVYVTKRRWLQTKTPKISLENGWTLQLEDAIQNEKLKSSAIVLEEGTDDFSIDFDQPRPGDLMYLPMLDNKIWQISFVDDDEMFHPLGHGLVFTVEANLYEASHEVVQTGIAEFDDIAAIFDGDMRESQILLETGDELLTEDGDTFILESAIPEESNPTANNTLFTTESKDVIDFSDKSPLIRYDSNRRW